MERPDRITLTSYWLDWVLLFATLGLGVLTLRWALADLEQAKSQQGSLPGWLIAVPLILCAFGWVTFGLGALIKEPYWEHRVYRVVFGIWILGCLMGVGIILLGLLHWPNFLGTAGVLNLIGLSLTVLMMTAPAFMPVPSGAQASRFSHVWSLLLVTAAACLTAGMLLGFPYNFPRFPLGITAVYLLGLGALEIDLAKPGMVWLPQLWKTRLGNEAFLDTLPTSSFWTLHGAIMLLIGVVVSLALLNESFHLIQLFSPFAL